MNIDFSPVVIREMLGRHLRKRPAMRWQVPGPDLVATLGWQQTQAQGHRAPSVVTDIADVSTTTLSCKHAEPTQTAVA